MLVTRIAHSKNLTARKFSELTEIATRLGRVRHEVWDRYGSASGFNAEFRKVRDGWVAQKRDFGVATRLWRETLRDTLDDIKARRESGFKSVAQKAYRKLGAKEGKVRCSILRGGGWSADPLLHRLVRKAIPRGRTWVQNQIVLEGEAYTHFQHGGKGWLEVMGLKPRKRIAIPLDTTYPIAKTIRLILRDGRVEVHYTMEVEARQSSGTAGEVGVDKGYTEVFVDSRGQHHGKGLGELLSSESDHYKRHGARLNKLRSIAKSKPHKADNIRRNNLGGRKANRRKSQHVSKVKKLVYQATHDVVRDATLVAHEDLKTPIRAKKSYGKDTNRRLSGWVKGMIQTALTLVSQRYGVPLVPVSACYTSQMCAQCGLLGERKGDTFYCTHYGCGVVQQADWNAALNVLARTKDPEIRVWMRPQKVKAILLGRAERQRLKPPSPDSSCSDIVPLSTESELFEELRSYA